MAIEPSGNQRGKLMWPPSLEAANQIGLWSNFFLICSLAVGVISTIGVVVTTSVKEGYWDSDRQHSAERIARLTTQADELRKDTAEANARAKEAELALEKLKRDRFVIPRAFGEQLKPFNGTEFDVSVASNDLEADNLAIQLIASLGRLAAWKQIAWIGPVAARQLPGPTLPVGPLPSSFGGMFTRGTLIAVHPALTTQKDSSELKAAEALAQALKDNGVDCVGVMGMETSANKNAVHLIIGHK
jgi:hypothetical protein